MSAILQQLNDEMAAVVNTVHRSLVQITNGRDGAGAGTIWRSDGLIITNAHVIAGHGPLTVTLSSGESYPAQVLASSKELDLAALSVAGSDLPAIELGDSQQIRPGQWVMALGHPWGVLNAATGGIVISMGKRLGDIEFQNGEDWIAVNLRLRPGHSGGPLVDAQGRLLGINTIMNGPEVGIAIPVHVVRRFLKDHLKAEPAQPIAV